MSRRAAGWAAAACAVAAMVGPAIPGRALAAEPAAFSGSAAAAGLRVTVTVPKFLVAETLADGGGPVTHAELSPLGGQSYASSVFPGDTAVAQQVAGVLHLPPPPDYPIQVSATYPLEPTATAAPAGQQMSALAGPTLAEGRAAVGGPPAATGQPAVATSTSLSRIEALADGSVVARAESVVEGASFPGGLHIARIVSIVTVTRRPGSATPVVESATTVIGTRVGDTAVQIGPDGILAPAPAGLPTASASALDAALANAGTTVRRVAGQPLPGGASADALEIQTSSVAVPGSPQATVVYRLGGAMATVLGQSPLSSALLLPVLPGVGTVPPVSNAPTSASDPTAVAGQVLPGPPSGSVLTAPAPQSSDAADMRATAATPAAFDVPAHLGLLYLVLLLGGAAAFAAASVLRRSGVLRPWN